MFVILIDSRYAFELPSISAGWIEAYDVETGQSRLMSSDDMRQIGARVAVWQETVEVSAADRGLEVLRLGAGAERFHHELVEFLADRRIRKR